MATAVYVHINTSWFRKNTNQYYSQGVITAFPVPTASSMEIINVAVDTLRKIYKPGQQYKKATVILHELKDADAVRSQSFLLEKNEYRNAERRTTERKVMDVLDRINLHHGRGSLFFAAEGIEKNWRPKREVISPCHTTSLNELPVVR